MNKFSLGRLLVIVFYVAVACALLRPWWGMFAPRDLWRGFAFMAFGIWRHLGWTDLGEYHPEPGETGWVPIGGIVGLLALLLQILLLLTVLIELWERTKRR